MFFPHHMRAQFELVDIKELKATKGVEEKHSKMVTKLITSQKQQTTTLQTKTDKVENSIKELDLQLVSIVHAQAYHTPS